MWRRSLFNQCWIFKLFLVLVSSQRWDAHFSLVASHLWDLTTSCWRTNRVIRFVSGEIKILWENTQNRWRCWKGWSPPCTTVASWGQSHTRTHTYGIINILESNLTEECRWPLTSPQSVAPAASPTFSEWRVSCLPAETAPWPRMTSCLGCILSAATGGCPCGLGSTCCRSWRTTSGCVTATCGSCCASGLRRSSKTERWVHWPELPLVGLILSVIYLRNSCHYKLS